MLAKELFYHRWYHSWVQAVVVVSFDSQYRTQGSATRALFLHAQWLSHLVDLVAKGPLLTRLRFLAGQLTAPSDVANFNEH